MHLVSSAVKTTFLTPSTAECKWAICFAALLHTSVPSISHKRVQELVLSWQFCWQCRRQSSLLVYSHASSADRRKTGFFVIVNKHIRNCSGDTRAPVAPLCQQAKKGRARPFQQLAAGCDEGAACLSPGSLLGLASSEGSSRTPTVLPSGHGGSGLACPAATGHRISARLVGVFPSKQQVFIRKCQLIRISRL